MDRITRVIQKIQLSLGVAAISIFFVAIMIQVIARYAKITVTWTGEVSTYSFIWAVFMGAGAMTYERRHFAFETLKQKLTLSNQLLLDTLIQLIILVFSVSTLYFGIIITQKFWNYRWIDLSFIKMGYTWLCVPFFGGSVTLYTIDNIYDNIRDLVKGGVKS